MTISQIKNNKIKKPIVFLVGSMLFPAFFLNAVCQSISEAFCGIFDDVLDYLETMQAAWKGE